ncbi:hypothetical protein PV779_53215 [Streptomyces sp. ID01-9D]|nr:hypothetical protein [Streptomyces sp. ID01-9D]
MPGTHRGSSERLTDHRTGRSRAVWRGRRLAGWRRCAVDRRSPAACLCCRTGVFLSLGCRQDRSYDGLRPSQEVR